MLHHVEINVPDLARSLRFWEWLLAELGYELYQSWPEGRSWKMGETYIVFVRTAERHRDAGYHRGHTGLNHLAFHAGSRERVDELVRGLLERGGTLLYPDRHPWAGGPEYYAAFLEDPDRFKVELVPAE